MATSDPLTDSARGYLSLESKRRFTLVAGILGAVFFFAQFLLPFLVMLLIMMPTMTATSVTTADLDEAAAWRNELWLVEGTSRINWRDDGRTTTRALTRVSPVDLSSAGPPISLGASRSEAGPSLLPIGDRLWVIGDTLSYYENGTLNRLEGDGRPAHSSRPFARGGRPAVITLGNRRTLAMLDVEVNRARWSHRELSFGLPAESGSLRGLQAIEVAGRLYLFVELCTDEPEHCSIRYREGDSEGWRTAVEDACSCANWTALELASRPTLALTEQQDGRDRHLELVTIGEDGPRIERVDLDRKLRGWSRWRAIGYGDRLLLASQSMPDSLSLTELAGGRVVRSLSRKGSLPFPFGPGMIAFMMVPQLLPVLLSLVLALLLTHEMRKHRVQDYVFEGSRRVFATLWQRALAQLVDALLLVSGFLLPMAWMWRFFSDPEQMAEQMADAGPTFMFWFFGLFVLAFVCAVLILVAFSYLEGRYGKTPGKWLLRIRVLGTDLRPCGFGRALVRNLLTFVDGFFNFLVGALLVALTENWQRLGDLAARTVVVADDRPA